MTPAEIARSLSAAQRAAFRRSTNKNMHPDWADHLSTWGDITVARELYHLALIQKAATLAPLTTIGLAVRKILEEQEG